MNEGECLLRLDMQELETLWQTRLQDRVPFQYLTQSVHWRDDVLTVGPGVLIPRPETELLIDIAESIIQRHPSLLHKPWADLGTGSGAIAIGLARLLEKRGGSGCVLAVDQSKICVGCAQRNVERLQLQKRIQLFNGNWCRPLQQWKGRLGGIISNPPYIPSSDLENLQYEIAKHEPRMALNGGALGITHLQTIISEAREYLASAGVLLLETNDGRQSEALSTSLTAKINSSCVSPFINVQIHQDLTGINRFVSAMK